MAVQIFSMSLSIALSSITGALTDRIFPEIGQKRPRFDIVSYVAGLRRRQKMNGHNAFRQGADPFGVARRDCSHADLVLIM